MPRVALRRARVIKGHKCRLNVGGGAAVAVAGVGGRTVYCKVVGEGDGLLGECRFMSSRLLLIGEATSPTLTSWPNCPQGPGNVICGNGREKANSGLGTSTSRPEILV